MTRDRDMMVSSGPIGMEEFGLVSPSPKNVELTVSKCMLPVRLGKAHGYIIPALKRGQTRRRVRARGLCWRHLSKRLPKDHAGLRESGQLTSPDLRSWSTWRKWATRVTGGS